MFNIPNILTLMRIACIPVFVLFFYLPFKYAHLVAALIFAFAAATDWLDGYLARYLKQTTRFGAFLDPVADKLMVAVALIMVISQPAFTFLVIPAAIIVGREIVISALREWMAELGKRTSVAVSRIGKVKTLVQMLALFLILLYMPHINGEWLRYLGGLLLWVAAILTIWSMVMYLKTAWNDLTLPEEKQ